MFVFLLVGMFCVCLFVCLLVGLSVSLFRIVFPCVFLLFLFCLFVSFFLLSAFVFPQTFVACSDFVCLLVCLFVC